MVIRKSRREVALMREAGRIVALTHARVREKIAPGVTTAELDAVAHEFVIKHKEALLQSAEESFQYPCLELF